MARRLQHKDIAVLQWNAVGRQLNVISPQSLLAYVRTDTQTPLGQLGPGCYSQEHARSGPAVVALARAPVCRRGGGHRDCRLFRNTVRPLATRPGVVCLSWASDSHRNSSPATVYR